MVLVPRFLAVLAYLMLASSGSVVAAEFREECAAGSCSILLYGPIEEGDAREFKDSVAQIAKRGQYVDAMYLMSPGGLIDEAMEIGRIVREGLIQTTAPRRSMFTPFDPSGLNDRQLMARCEGVCFSYFSMISIHGHFTSSRRAAAGENKWLSGDSGAKVDQNTLCASACALIAMAGVERSGTIGLHHIYIPSGDLDYSDLERRLTGGTSEVEAYLQEMRIPREVIDRVFATASNDLDWISTGAGLSGTDPIFREYLNSKCPAISERERDEWFNLQALRDRGWYIAQGSPYREVRRKFTRDDANRLAYLERLSLDTISCSVRTVANAQKKAQSNWR